MENSVQLDNAIKWNSKVKIIVSDVDETIADLFLPASLEVIEELNMLLSEGKSIVFVTGAGLESVRKRIINLMDPKVRKQILISHCSGAEVIGFDEVGELQQEPHYSTYDKALTQHQKDQWRDIVKQIISEFRLEIHPPLPLEQFEELYGNHPLTVMYEDRGPQITLEFVNAYNLRTEQIEELKNHLRNFDMADLRIPVMERVSQLLEEENIPITPRLGGMFALDLAIKGVSKTTPVQFILNDQEVLKSIGMNRHDISDSQAIEVWGDKFSVLNGGTDRHISEALSPSVRSIDFRGENPEEFLPGYNIVLWTGNKRLCEGLLEYLQSRALSV